MDACVAVLGATGLVGRTMLTLLEERNFPVGELVPLASARSAGGHVPFRGREIEVLEATPESFSGVDVVLASAGAAASRELLPEAVSRGVVCVDNSSAFRMDEAVPLVVPEVNAHRIADHQGIIANPNCSTIQLVVVLEPLAQAVGLKRVVVSTYQSVSGAGQASVDELREETAARLAGVPFESEGFRHQMAFNVLPEIDVFLEGGETKEEWKMRVESRKILERDIPLHATCVRVPVLEAHSEAVWVETEEPLSPVVASKILAAAPGVVVAESPEAYPTAVGCTGRDEVFVGRLRRDPTVPHGLSMWIVSDNLRKGAALNAVQIAERLVGDSL